MQGARKIKGTLKALDHFKNKQKSVWSNVFRYVKLCIFWKCIQCTTYWDKTQMLKKFLLTKKRKKQYKKCPLFLSRAPTRHSFTFHLRFLYELKHKVCLSKTVCGIFYFRSNFVYIEVYFVVHFYSLPLKRHNSFQN